MILKALKTFFTTPAEKLAGSELPQRVEKITECYAKLDTSNRWQGDVYPVSSFSTDSLPYKGVPYWMVINRTCHMYEGNGRVIKLPHLNFAAVYRLRDAIDLSKDVKNQLSHIVNGKSDNIALLPENTNHYEVSEPLIVNFNILNTLPIEKCPPAIEKCIQLSSPFCEHVFQKLSRYFYTVGFDDENLKSKEYVEALIEFVQTEKK